VFSVISVVNPNSYVFQENQTRTHLDRQGAPAEAGAAHPAGGTGQVPSREAPGEGIADFNHKAVVLVCK